MNKSKIVLASVGGFFAVLALAAGWLVWSAMSDCEVALNGDEAGEVTGLSSVCSEAQGLVAKRPYPCAESVKELKRQCQQYADWKDAARQLAERGDTRYPSVSDATFKTFLVGDAKRLNALPGGVLGRLTKPEFAFGPFSDFITGVKMPQKADLPRLQRQWDDLARIAEILSSAGVVELLDVACLTAAPKAEEADAQKSERRPRNKKKNKSAKAEAEQPKGLPCQSYQIVFATRAEGFVKALTALTTDDRFMIVDDFAFRRAKDTITLGLTGEKKAEEAETPRRRGRNRNAEAEQKDKAESTMAPGSVVVDPQFDEPLNVTLTVSVYDFGSLLEEKK